MTYNDLDEKARIKADIVNEVIENGATLTSRR